MFEIKDQKWLPGRTIQDGISPPPQWLLLAIRIHEDELDDEEDRLNDYGCREMSEEHHRVEHDVMRKIGLQCCEDEIDESDHRAYHITLRKRRETIRCCDYKFEEDIAAETSDSGYILETINDMKAIDEIIETHNDMTAMDNSIETNDVTDDTIETNNNLKAKDNIIKTNNDIKAADDIIETNNDAKATDDSVKTISDICTGDEQGAYEKEIRDHNPGTMLRQYINEILTPDGEGISKNDLLTDYHKWEKTSGVPHPDTAKSHKLAILFDELLIDIDKRKDGARMSNVRRGKQVMQDGVLSVNVSNHMHESIRKQYNLK
ncbi:hypothetical protein HDU93_001425, partial [Gonapodya sp. JEL0774]